MERDRRSTALGATHRAIALALLAFIAITTTASDLGPMRKECCDRARSPVCEKQCKRLVRRPVANNGTAKGAKRVEERLADCREPGFRSCVDAALYGRRRVASTPTPVAAKVAAASALSCCEAATNDACRQTCRRTLDEAGLTEEERIRAMMGPCGPPPGGHLWQCFLSGGVTIKDTDEPSTGFETETKAHVLPLNGAKLLCCDKGKSTTCQDHCIQLFSAHSWSASETDSRWSDFQSKCLSNPKEGALTNCIEDVSRSCQPGCSDLNFCRQFSKERLFHSYRSCSPSADIAARIVLSDWESNKRVHHPLAAMPADVENCRYDAWKALACVSQLKPCHADYQSVGICYDDCVSLLSDCLDKSVSFGYAPAEFCSLISIENETKCIRLSIFEDKLSERKEEKEDEKGVPATRPCQPDLCLEGEICEIDGGAGNRLKFRCVKGCKGGRLSDFYARQGDWIKIPLTDNPACRQMCYCDSNRQLSQCVELPCSTGRVCRHKEEYLEHGAGFAENDSLCACFNEQLECKKFHFQNSTPNGTSLILWINHEKLRMVDENWGGNATETIVNQLRRFLTALECQLTGTFADSNLLILNFTARSAFQSLRQERACSEEARRLFFLIASGSPLIKSNPYLSALSSIYLYMPEDVEPTRQWSGTEPEFSTSESAFFAGTGTLCIALALASLSFYF